MTKLWLIIKREYLSRVTRRSFILATLLTPLGFAVFFIVVGFIFQYKSDDSKRVAVIDESNMLQSLKDQENITFLFTEEKLSTLRKQMVDKKSKFDAVLVIPALQDVKLNEHTIYFYSKDQPTLDIQSAIQSQIAKAIRKYKIEKLNLDTDLLDALDTRVDLDPEPLQEGEKDANKLTSAITAGLGMIMGLIMYLSVFIYGMMIMRSVMEEKTNRIVEVMISSVKPFQLMLGKIIGVSGVGFTQFVIWSILIPIISVLVRLVFGFEAAPNTVNVPEINPDDAEAMMTLAISEINKLNWWVILPSFLVFFLGGYFLYASLFAAVGSAIGDDMGEGQSLTLPITIPVILAVYIMIVAVQSPNSSLARFASIFPLFSPIVMPARLAFEPPWWEVALSMIILLGTALFFVWVSGRIYRIGILMYGKKVGFKDMFRWMRTR